MRTAAGRPLTVQPSGERVQPDGARDTYGCVVRPAISGSLASIRES